jgi:hypothetical protein
VSAAHPLDLGRGVDREHARSVEPELVARALEELQERVTVARGPVAEARALGEWAGLPRELAAGDEQLRELLIAGRDRRERSDDAGRPVAPLGLDLGRASGLERGGPLREAVFSLRVSGRCCDDTPF